MNDFTRIKEEKKRWESEYLSGSSVEPASTPWGSALNIVYTPDDLANLDFLKDIGFPGKYPFLRGVYPSMFRGRLWTMRQYAGFGSPEETNALFESLLSQGQMGLSVAFDLPTQTGFDSDNPLVEDEVGRVGVAVDTLRDMEIIFEDIPLDKVTTSFTVNPTASIILAMYIAVAEKRGVSSNQIGGTLQNDILKEFLARGTQIFPPEPSLRLVGDIIEYCKDNATRINTISICGYHMREAGCNLIQEIAYGLSNAIVYVEEALKRGIKIDEFAPRLSFLFQCGMNLFEEVAKLRAARYLWGKIMRERFNAKNPDSMKLRLFSGCAASAFASKEPHNNIIRGTIMTLVAVLGGAQSIHTTSYDEAYTIPTEVAQRTALRTQQIIAYETDAAAVVDPLGGSYFLEYLTNKIAEEVEKEMTRIEENGGMLKGIENGSIRKIIDRQAYETEKKVQSAEKIIVGVNKFISEEKEYDVDLHISSAKNIRERQIARLKEVKKKRNNNQVKLALNEVRRVAMGKSNLMVPILAAVSEYATIGEICDVLRGVFGEYREYI